MTKFELLELLVDQVETWWIGEDDLRSKESAISKRESLWDEWNE